MNNKNLQLLQKINKNHNLSLLDRVLDYLDDLYYLEDYMSEEQIILRYRLHRIKTYYEMSDKWSITTLAKYIKNKLPNTMRYKDEVFTINICVSDNDIQLFIQDERDQVYISTNAFVLEDDDNKEYYFHAFYYDYNDNPVSIRLESSDMDDIRVTFTHDDGDIYNFIRELGNEEQIKIALNELVRNR